MKKQLTMIAFFGVALANGLAMGATSINPASGHPFYASEAARFNVFDTQVCTAHGTANTYAWSTPLVYDTTKTSINTCFRQTGRVSPQSAVWSFTETGAFLDWSGWKTGSGCTGAVDVQAAGTAFLKTLLVDQWEPGAADGCLTRVTLY